MLRSMLTLPVSFPKHFGGPMRSKLEKKKELQKLVTLGKEKGFLTYEEINDALPENITESEQLDEVMALLEDAEIGRS